MIVAGECRLHPQSWLMSAGAELSVCSAEFEGLDCKSSPRKRLSNGKGFLDIVSLSCLGVSMC